MVGTIVCAVDDSAEAAEALRAAARLSRDAGLRLVVVHVEDTTGAGSDVRRSAEERSQLLLHRLLRAQGLNGGVDKRIELGDPVHEVARVATEEAADVIVLGSRRRHWRPGGRISKFTADLTATADCPVMVVPPQSRR